MPPERESWRSFAYDGSVFALSGYTGEVGFSAGSSSSSSSSIEKQHHEREEREAAAVRANYFAAGDTDGDGALSLAEARHQGMDEQTFAEVDADANGQLSEEEFAEWQRKTRREKRGFFAVLRALSGTMAWTTRRAAAKPALTTVAAVVQWVMCLLDAILRGVGQVRCMSMHSLLDCFQYLSSVLSSFLK